MATMRRRVGGFGTGMATGARGGLTLLARLVRLVAFVVTAIIVIGILLHVLHANRGNQIVSTLLDWARWLVGPFKDIFTIKGDWRIVVNWGLAAVVYNVVAHLIARLLRR